jgi:hypothetical protein
MKQVSDLENINALLFNRQSGLGYHCLQPADASLLLFAPNPVRLVRDQQDAILQMRIEPPDHLIGSGDLKRMGTENPLEGSG